MAFIRLLQWTADKGASAHETGTLVVEFPAGNKELHGDRIVSGAEPVGLVEPVRGFERREIDLYAEAGAVWKGDLAAGDPQGVFGEVLAVLPDPVGIDGGHLAGRR